MMGNYTLAQLGQQMLNDWPKKKKKIQLPLKIFYDNLPLQMFIKERVAVKPPSKDCPPFFCMFFLKTVYLNYRYQVLLHQFYHPCVAKLPIHLRYGGGSVTQTLACQQHRIISLSSVLQRVFLKSLSSVLLSPGISGHTNADKLLLQDQNCFSPTRKEELVT